MNSIENEIEEKYLIKNEENQRYENFNVIFFEEDKTKFQFFNFMNYYEKFEDQKSEHRKLFLNGLNLMSINESYMNNQHEYMENFKNLYKKEEMEGIQKLKKEVYVNNDNEIFFNNENKINFLNLFNDMAGYYGDVSIGNEAKEKINKINMIQNLITFSNNLIKMINREFRLFNVIKEKEMFNEEYSKLIKFNKNILKFKKEEEEKNIEKFYDFINDFMKILDEIFIEHEDDYKKFFKNILFLNYKNDLDRFIDLFNGDKYLVIQFSNHFVNDHFVYLSEVNKNEKVLFLKLGLDFFQFFDGCDDALKFQIIKNKEIIYSNNLFISFDIIKFHCE
jgi:hypothetical protein